MFKNILYTVLILVLLSACQSVKDGLSGAKQTNSDEFLVEKKNPLTIPSEFNKLPVPTELIKNKSDKDTDLRDILTKDKSKKNKPAKIKVSNGSLEKSILEKIKSN